MNEELQEFAERAGFDSYGDLKKWAQKQPDFFDTTLKEKVINKLISWLKKL